MQTEKIQSQIIIEEDEAKIEVFPLQANEEILFELFKDIFEKYWNQVQFIYYRTFLKSLVQTTIVDMEKGFVKLRLARQLAHQINSRCELSC